MRIRAAALAAVVGTILLGLKYSAYQLTGSTAILSDTLESIINVVAALFGIWFAGGVYVPLNPRLSADELAHVIAEDRPAAIVSQPDDADRILDVPVVLARGDGTWDAPGPLDADAPPSAPGVAAISFTSGTTGRPKPVPLEDAEVERIMRRMKSEAPTVRIGFQKGDAVRIKDGPFADFIGTVDEVNEERGKVRVHVSFFGRETPVELDFLQVKKI